MRIIKGKVFYVAEFCYKCTDFYHPGDESGFAWNAPEIGIIWPNVVGEYRGNASADGYRMKDCWIDSKEALSLCLSGRIHESRSAYWLMRWLEQNAANVNI